MTTIVRAVPWRLRLLRTYATAPLPRVYRYWVDVHGQLFLYDTVPKNLTSCKPDRSGLMQASRRRRFLTFFSHELSATRCGVQRRLDRQVQCARVSRCTGVRMPMRWRR